MSESVARAMWERFEPVHQLVYFAPEVRQVLDGLGLRGYWMGYFALRAAPLGPVPASVVTSCFYVFHPDRAASALPDAWALAPPQQVIEARERAVDAAMTNLYGPDVVASAEVAEAADLAWEAARAANTAGRVLGAANQALPRPAQPHVRLWQSVTTLREHRGDGHVAMLVGRRLGPVEALVLKSATGETDAEFQRRIRQWNGEEWRSAQAELGERGWIDEEGRLTGAGAAAHEQMEAETDAAALTPWQALGADATTRLAHLLEPLARRTLDSGIIPTGNPVGLTEVTWSSAG
ncbi:SCO6745 family protein [Streptomyces hawaiiensis]|uniref:SCO6745 family protein n=1 Tax=Streptomyces hawaiiensis TaxID=67305 RepID=UPI003649DF5A